jgi:serine/threonine protein kinase
MDTATPDSQALPPGARLEEFVIESVLGAGGFGITYLATDTSLGRKVVIKENLPSQFAWRETSTGTVRPRHSTGGDMDDFEWSMKNFLRESETLASLDHPGIVRVLRQFSANGTAYFVMPFVEGVPFDSLINERSGKGKPFSQDELLGLTTRILDALGYIHRCNIYHRDIKPANILITREGIPVLIDFGSARQSIGERSMTVIESAGYTPFEQLQSRGNIGPWSDLYAFGATLAKAITFETPPKAADRMMGDPWRGLAVDSRCSSFSNWFLQAIDRSMAVDPTKRWQSAKEWRGLLEGGDSHAELISTHSVVPFPPPLPDSPNIEQAQKHIGTSALKQTSQDQVRDSSLKGDNLSPSCSWEDTHLTSRCPHCGEGFRLRIKALKKPMIKCPVCSKGIVPSCLSELHPENEVTYSVSLAQLLFSYRGRVGRREYWLVSAVPALVMLVLAVILLESAAETIGFFLLLLWFAWSIGVCIPITAKRLHDHNMSGHLTWLLLIPYVNSFIAIWFLIRLGMMPGKSITNKYGPPISQIKTPFG